LVTKAAISRFISEKSIELGFDACGIAEADFLSEDAPRLEAWLQKDFHGDMSYMENHFDKRLDPRKLLDGTRSVVTVIQNYFPEYKQPKDVPQISKYAYGKDYHKVIKKKLQKILDGLQQFGNIQGRAFTDSAPILERSWAQKSGIGWLGKNGMLINKKLGSFYFIGVLLLDVELNYEAYFPTDHCGTCTKCIDACPTQAILPNKEINGSQCISYYTIELKDSLIQTDKTWDDWMFGCDVCQDVCPWNRFATTNTEKAFEPRKEILGKTQDEWLAMNEDAFSVLSQASPIKRSKLEGIKRNVSFLKKT